MYYIRQIDRQRNREIERCMYIYRERDREKNYFKVALNKCRKDLLFLTNLRIFRKFDSALHILSFHIKASSNFFLKSKFQSLFQSIWQNGSLQFTLWSLIRILVYLWRYKMRTQARNGNDRNILQEDENLILTKTRHYRRCTFVKNI